MKPQEMRLDIKRHSYNGKLQVACCVSNAKLRVGDDGKLALHVYGLGHNEIPLIKHNNVIQGTDGYYKAAVFPYRGNLSVLVCIDYA